MTQPDDERAPRPAAHNTDTPPQPRNNIDGDALLHPITFFVRAGERREILRALRAIDADRVRALRRALGMPCIREEGGNEQ